MRSSAGQDAWRRFELIRNLHRPGLPADDLLLLTRLVIGVPEQQDDLVVDMTEAGKELAERVFAATGVEPTPYTLASWFWNHMLCCSAQGFALMSDGFVHSVAAPDRNNEPVQRG